MPLDFTSIANLAKGNEEETLKIKAQVSRVWRFNTEDNSTGDGGFDLLLVDDKGDRIQACVRGKLVDKFSDKFEAGEWCVLINFKLSPNLQGFRAIKYLFKYINKGNDRLKAKLDSGGSESTSQKQVDEIKNYLDFRYISPCEASWRILGYELHYCSTSIQRLSFHMPGDHTITFEDDDDVEDVLAKEGNQTSQFLEWMKMNSQNPEAKKLTYIEFPTRFVWNRSNKDWTPRKRSQAIGRIPYKCSLFKEIFQNLRHE